MGRPRLSALICSLALVLSLAPLTAAHAAAAPVLVGVTGELDAVSVPHRIVSTVRFAGEVSGAKLIWTHDLANGIAQTLESPGFGVLSWASEGQISQALASPIVNGTWTLTKASLSDLDGNQVVYGAGGLPFPMTAPQVTVSDGLASINDALPDLGTITSATLVAASPPATVGTGATVSTTVGYSGVNGVRIVPIYRQKQTGLLRGLSGTTVSGTGSTSPNVSITSPNFSDGDWTLDRVVESVDNLVRIYYSGTPTGAVRTFVQRRGTWLAGEAPSCGGTLGDFGSPEVLPDGCVELGPATNSLAMGDTHFFTVAGVAPADAVAPTVTGLALDSPSVTAGGDVTVSATYHDAVSLPKPGYVFEVSARRGAVELGSGTPMTTCSGSAPYSTCTVSTKIHTYSGTLNGAYTLQWAAVWDAAGNRTYYADGTATAFTGVQATTRAVTVGEPHMPTLTFTVTGGVNEDTTPPVLTSFARTSATRGQDPGSTAAVATFAWSATDVGSGLGGVVIHLMSPAGVENDVAGDVSGDHVSGTVTVTTTDVVPGDWIVRYVLVGDLAGNRRRYDLEGGVVPGPGPHSFDLATPGFTVVTTTPVDVPSAPRGLGASGRDATLRATWATPAHVGASPITGYHVVLQPGNVTHDVPAAAREAVFTGLANNVGYTTTVSAITAIGNGNVAWHLPVAVRPVAPIVGPTLKALAVSSLSTTVPLSATAPVAQLGAPVTGYRTQVKVAVAGAALPAKWTMYGAVRATPSGAVSGIARGARLCARIVAVNAIGAGATSAVTCTTVLADDRTLVRSGRWSSVTLKGAYLGTLTTSRSAGAALSSGASRGSAVLVRARMVPGGGTVAVYVGATRVATWKLSARKAAWVTGTFVARLTGQKVVLRVIAAGTAGVQIDGFGIRA